MPHPKKIAVIGAGIAGLSLARSLQGLADVTVFEKSRGVGGRMATRRAGEIAFDHGAQYFTIRDPAFHAALEPAIELGVVETWSGMIGSFLSGPKITVDEGNRWPRFVGVPSMTAVPKWLSRGLEIRLSANIVSIEGSAKHWTLKTQSERIGPFDWVVTSCPAPQALALMPKNFSKIGQMASSKMNACFTLMLRLRSFKFGRYCAIRYDDEVIALASDGTSRPQRSPLPSLVVQSQNEWADLHVDDALENVQALMLDRLGKLSPDISEQILSCDIHRWRFANVQTPCKDELFVDFENGLAACGDWTIGNRVEAAFLSASKLSEAMGGKL
jgi:predicted NAD/FAD-dependent oxidoreductase